MHFLNHRLRLHRLIALVEHLMKGTGLQLMLKELYI